MKLIKNGRVIDPKSQFDARADILIDGQKIIAIGQDLTQADAEIIDATGKIVAPGLIDGHVHFREPGQTHKEDIHTGSLVISKRVSPENLVIGDVVTFKSKDDSTTLVTHRIEQISKENGELSFITKGDANDVIDLEPVKPENIIARVQYDIPYLGYMTEFIKTKQGMLLVVIIPAIALLLIEIFKLIGYASELDKQKKAQNHEIKF